MTGEKSTSSNYDSSILNNVFENSHFSGKSKRAIKFVLLEGMTHEKAGKKVGGMSKQYVWRIVTAAKKRYEAAK